MRVERFGPDALLIRLADHRQAYALLEQWHARFGDVGDVGDAVLDLVPAARSVLVHLKDDRAPGADSALLEALRASPDPDPDPEPGRTEQREPRIVEIAVRYDGPDLQEVADRTGLSPVEVVHAHAGATYEAAFAGFAPGFVYLTGLPEVLRLPRRESPRTRVPAASVAIAHEHSAVYPRSSPGGWHLIGQTDAVMFDAERSPAALIAPGDRVRFVPVGGAR